MNKDEDRTQHYRKDSLTLVGAVALGTGVMIGAGIFALTGQMAQMTGSLFPLAFLSAAVIVSFSAYSYVKMSCAYPSAGGIAMYLKKAYGSTVTTAFHSLLMYFSMVIAQSFLARTFSTYTLQLFGIEGVASVLGFIKIGGIVLFGIVGVMVADTVEVNFSTVTPDASMTGFIGATALGILAFTKHKKGAEKWTHKQLLTV